MIGIGFSVSLITLGLMAPVESTAQNKANKKGSAQKGQSAIQTSKATQPNFDSDVKAVIEKYCVSCHSDSVPPGGVALKKGLSAGDVQKNSGTWQRIAKNVAMKHMPPEGSPSPSQDQRIKFVNWIDGALVQDCKLADPGRVTLRRLNREEYNNTVRDLLGVTIRPADDFPSDDVGYGQ